MCELLVRVIDKVGTNPYSDAACTKAGDVIAVQPDGWAWGKAEVADPQYRIVRAPLVSIEQAQTLLAGEPETDLAQPNYMRQRRLFRLDLDKLHDGMRELPRIRKHRLADPNVMD